MSEGFNVSANWRRSGKPGQEKQSPGPQKTKSATQAGLSYQPARLVYQTGLVIQPKISEKLQKDFNKIPISQVGLPGWITRPADRTGRVIQPGKRPQVRGVPRYEGSPGMRDPQV